MLPVFICLNLCPRLFCLYFEDSVLLCCHLYLGWSSVFALYFFNSIDPSSEWHIHNSLFQTPFKCLNVCVFPAARSYLLQRTQSISQTWLDRRRNGAVIQNKLYIYPLFSTYYLIKISVNLRARIKDYLRPRFFHLFHFKSNLSSGRLWHSFWQIRRGFCMDSAITTLKCVLWEK